MGDPEAEDEEGERREGCSVAVRLVGDKESVEPSEGLIVGIFEDGVVEEGVDVVLVEGEVISVRLRLC